MGSGGSGEGKGGAVVFVGGPCGGGAVFERWFLFLRWKYPRPAGWFFRLGWGHQVSVGFEWGGWEGTE